jgi:hypothetical protein
MHYMNKPYTEMTSAERLALRMAQNRAIEQQIAERQQNPVATNRVKTLIPKNQGIRCEVGQGPCVIRVV